MTGSFDVVAELRNAVSRIESLDASHKEARAALDRLSALQVPNAKGLVMQSSINHQQNQYKGEWNSLGEFALSVKRVREGNECPKMKAYITKAPTGLGEQVGTDGGFLVPPQFVNQLLMRVYSNPLLQMITLFPMATNALKIPSINETSRADGSRYGGVRSFWRGEAGAYTESKPKFGQVGLSLETLTILMRLTEELLADSAVALEQFITMVATSETLFKLGDAIVNGDGVGKPIGLLNSDARVAVAKENLQEALTVNVQNINKMWARLFAPCQPNSVWLINQDVQPQLDGLTLGSGVAGWPVYLPPGGLSASPYGMLKGRPVIPVEFCSTVGTEGDIILVDLSQYVGGTKGGMQTAMSAHLHFDTNEQTFRLTYRFDGKPWWVQPLTPYKGGNTQSFCVTLATRS